MLGCGQGGLVEWFEQRSIGYAISGKGCLEKDQEGIAQPARVRTVLAHDVVAVPFDQAHCLVYGGLDLAVDLGAGGGVRHAQRLGGRSGRLAVAALRLSPVGVAGQVARHGVQARARVGHRPRYHARGRESGPALCQDGPV